MAFEDLEICIICSDARADVCEVCRRCSDHPHDHQCHRPAALGRRRLLREVLCGSYED